jgi:hypothetical protein
LGFLKPGLEQMKITARGCGKAVRKTRFGERLRNIAYRGNEAMSSAKKGTRL